MIQCKLSFLASSCHWRVIFVIVLARPSGTTDLKVVHVVCRVTLSLPWNLKNCGRASPLSLLYDSSMSTDGSACGQAGAQVTSIRQSPREVTALLTVYELIHSAFTLSLYLFHLPQRPDSVEASSHDDHDSLCRQNVTSPATTMLLSLPLS